MCKGKNNFIDRFKQNHELHAIIIALIIYSQSKNIVVSGGVGGLIYYVMIIKEKKEKQKEVCGCEEKKENKVQVAEKSNVNNYAYPWSIM